MCAGGVAELAALRAFGLTSFLSRSRTAPTSTHGRCGCRSRHRMRTCRAFTEKSGDGESTSACGARRSPLTPRDARRRCKQECFARTRARERAGRDKSHGQQRSQDRRRGRGSYHASLDATAPHCNARAGTSLDSWGPQPVPRSATGVPAGVHLFFKARTVHRWHQGGGPTGLATDEAPTSVPSASGVLAGSVP